MSVEADTITGKKRRRIKDSKIKMTLNLSKKYLRKNTKKRAGEQYR